MDGKRSKSNLKNFRSNRPALIAPTRANPSSSTRQDAHSSRASIATNGMSASKEGTSMQSAANLASMSAMKSPRKVHDSTPSVGRSPSRKIPSASVFLKELQATQAALNDTQAAPVQTTQRVASHFTQDRLASSSALNASSPTAAQVAASLKNLSSTSTHPTPVSLPTMSTVTANHSPNMPVVSIVPSRSQPALSPPSTFATPPQFASWSRSLPTSTYTQNPPSSGLSNLATGGTHAFRAGPQVYDARGGWVSQTTPSPAEQVTQRISQLLMPSLTAIENRQAMTIDQLLVSDQMLRDLVVEVKNLGDKEKERQKKEVEREEREKNTVKALLLLAERTQGVKKSLAKVETVIGVERIEFGNVTMLDRLGKIEMSVEEWLERLRDPKADGMDVDGNDSAVPSTPAVAAPSIPIVRHEMAVSPIKPVAPIARMYTSVQVGTSLRSRTPTQDFANAAGTLRSKDTAYTSLEDYSEPKSKTMATSGLRSVNDPVNTQSSQAEDPSSTPTRSGVQKRNSDPLPVTQTDPQPVTPIMKTASVGSFSPVDWSKSSPNAQQTNLPAVIAPLDVDVTPKHKKSYVLPTVPEGTIAALRQEALGDPYPYRSIALSGDGDASGSGLVMVSVEVAGAGLKAAERMLSPESMCEVEVDNPSEEEDQLIDDVPAELPNERSPSKSHTSGLTEDENTVMTLVMDGHPPSTSPVVVPPNKDHSEYSISNVLPYASNVHLVTPQPKKQELITEETEGDISFAGESLAKLQEWYTKTRTETMEKKNKEGSHSATSADQSLPAVVEIVDQVTEIKEKPGKNKKRRRSPSVISISSDSDVNQVKEVKPQSTPTQTSMETEPGTIRPFPNHEKPSHTKNSVPLPGPKKIKAPLFDLTSESERSSTTPANTAPLSNLKRLIANLMEDDVDVVSVKKERKPSTQSPASTSNSSIKVAHNSRAIKKPVQPLDRIVSAPPTIKQPEKKSLLSVHKQKKGPSAASTRIKKRKAPQQHQDERDEDDSDQPPLKRLKLRRKALDRTANVSSSSSNSKASSVVKSETPVRTPIKRVRDSQPRVANVVWPKIEKPTFEQFIECDSCDRWYHIGCVGLHPGDIRLSGSEVYHCPPCEAGIHKDALSPAKNNRVGSENVDCSRPQCVRPTIKSAGGGGGGGGGEEETYIVESFVGMKKKSVGGRGLQIQYLVKWFGYELKEATWESEEYMKLPNSGVFIEKFEEQAKKEMLDVSQCNQEAVLLKCAARAGWNAQGAFVGKQV